MAKRTVYVSESASTLTVKRSDVEKLKKASISLFREYKKLKVQQKKFDETVATLAMVLIHWTIPKRDLP
jgi:hypothetical protein